MGVVGGEDSEPWRRAQQQGCRGQSGEIPAQRISSNQHSPAREDCLLTRRGRRGLGAEAQASEVRPQGEDWGWLREHSLKGAIAPQPAGRESGKKSGTAEEARDHCFRVHEERGVENHLNKLQRQARAIAISVDHRDGHERLRPRSLCASKGHYPHLPSQEPVQPATARVQ